ncbi:MAG: helix-turn-helix domain-containing protein [Pirellulales bacterium]
MPETRRSPCPIACALDLLGDRWTLLIVRDLACGKSQFKEFRASPEGIATNILTDRLQRLVEQGLVEKRPLDETTLREGYALTKTGATLIPLLRTVADWGLKHLPGTEARMTIRDPAPRGMKRR